MGLGVTYVKTLEDKAIIGFTENFDRIQLAHVMLHIYVKEKIVIDSISNMIYTVNGN